MDLTPFNIFGGVIGIFLVFRTNAGYERWWEARKIWGGIVNQSRNIVVGAISYGPQDKHWVKQVVDWTSAFSFLAKAHLRGERVKEQICEEFGVEMWEQLESAQHPPLEATRRIADLMLVARQQGEMDPYAFMNLDQERNMLLNYMGACERILKTPMPYVYAIKIRRFVVMFLMLVPIAIVTDFGWMTPLIMLFIAYPMLSLDQIGQELQNPFAKDRLSHLPLDEICTKIRSDLLMHARNSEQVDSIPLAEIEGFIEHATQPSESNTDSEPSHQEWVNTGVRTD